MLRTHLANSWGMSEWIFSFTPLSRLSGPQEEGRQNHVCVGSALLSTWPNCAPKTLSWLPSENQRASLQVTWLSFPPQRIVSGFQWQLSFANVACSKVSPCSSLSTQVFARCLVVKYPQKSKQTLPPVWTGCWRASTLWLIFTMSHWGFQGFTHLLFIYLFIFYFHFPRI